MQDLGSQDRESKPDGGDTPSCQPDAQGLAAFFQSPLQRAERPAELPGRFIAGQPGQVTQQQGRTPSLRQVLQFLVERLANLLPNHEAPGSMFSHGSGSDSL